MKDVLKLFRFHISVIKLVSPHTIRCFSEFCEEATPGSCSDGTITCDLVIFWISRLPPPSSGLQISAVIEK